MKVFFSTILIFIFVSLFSCATSVKDLETYEYIEVVKATLTTASSIEEFKRRIDTFGFKEEGEEITNTRGYMEKVTTYKNIHKGTEITINLYSNLENASFYFALVSNKIDRK